MGYICSFSMIFLASIVGAQSWDNLSSLKPGDGIQIVDQKLHDYKGKFVSLTDDAITFDTASNKRAAKGASGPVTLQRADVLRISATGSRRHRNTMLGLAVGAGAGAAILGGAVAANCCNSDYTAAYAIGLPAAAGAGIGALVGAGLGHGLSPSDTLYRGERKRP